MTVTSKAVLPLDAPQVLRSINIVFDADQPKRIAHFVPTAKTARLLGAFLSPGRGKTFFIVAPYGSGKSLTATYFLQCIENSDSSAKTLRELTDRLSRVDPTVSVALSERIHPQQRAFYKPRGMVLALSGYQHELPSAMKNAAIASLRRIGLDKEASGLSRKPCKTLDEALSLLDGIRAKLIPQKIDQICLIWDEFGRHIEELTSRGAATALNDIQTLAEFASRFTQPSFVIALLLHQGLMRYASGVSLTVQQEWRKIEGRFETIQFVDDSREIYVLISEIVSQRRDHPTIGKEFLLAAVAGCRRAGLFSDFDNEAIRLLLTKSYPLEPITLYLLPRISSRVAQNERSLFTFLFDSLGDKPVGPERIFDYFSDPMRADTSPGGTYRAWLETQSALSKVESTVEERALKCACLLGMGLSGERSRVGKELLLFGMSGFRPQTQSKRVVDALSSKKLLLYRANTDSISVWHGTDVDLRGRLDQAKARLGSAFEIIPFLSKEVPLPVWKPTEYNSRYSIERFFEAHYLKGCDILINDEKFSALFQFKERSDGAILVIVPETEQELGQIRNRISRMPSLDARFLLAIPQRAEQLFDLCLEVHCLQTLLQDSALLSEDPLVEPELQHMIDDAQGYLATVLDRLYSPSPDGPTYLHEGRLISLTSQRQLRSYLSKIMTIVYPLTPRIRNELIVRQKPRQAIVNARKKLILGILDRSGRPAFGLQGNRPDMSMYRTILFHTGLYRQEGEEIYSFARVKDVAQDTGLKKVWGLLSDFLTKPSREPKLFASLFAQLEAPPIGLRKGLHPIFLAAGLRAFPSASVIFDQSGTYLADILPTTIEDICAKPTSYSIHVFKLQKAELAYLNAICDIFRPREKSHTSEIDPLRRCYDAIAKWRAELPRAAFMGAAFSDPTALFVRLLNSEPNPYKLFVRTLPSELGENRDSYKRTQLAIRRAKSEIEGVVAKYYDAARRSLHSAFSLDTRPDCSIHDIARTWASFLPADSDHLIAEALSGAFVTRVRLNYDSDLQFIDSVCSLVVGKPVGKWDDSTIAAFDREVHSIVARIEDAAWSHNSDSLSESGLVTLASARLRNLYGRLTALVGSSEAQRIAKQVIAEPVGVRRR